MSESPPSSSTADRRPFQFSLAAAFTVVTGLCIILSLVVWDPNAGSALAILTVGSFWTLAAVRSGYRRLAYHLVCLPLGVVAYGLLSLPVSPVTRELLLGWDTSFSRRPTWPLWQPVVMMCLATCVAALALRRWIRRPGRVRPAVLGLAAIFLTATLFGLCYVLPPRSGSYFGGANPLTILWLAVMLPVFGIMVGVMSLHVSWPAPILFCVLLRWIDPEVREAEGVATTITGSDSGGTQPLDSTAGGNQGQ